MLGIMWLATDKKQMGSACWKRYNYENNRPCDHSKGRRFPTNRGMMESNSEVDIANA